MYKTILAHAGPPFDAGVGRVAAWMAQAFDARLVGVACSGIELLLAPGLVETGSEALARHAMDKVDDASSALESLRECAREAGIEAIEAKRLNGRAERDLAEQMLFADIAVIGQGRGHRPWRNGWRTIPEQLLRNAARPVVVVPDGYAGQPCGERVVIAWDGSLAAARAVSASMPILEKASVVEAITYSTEDGMNMPGELESLAAYLSAHGVYARSRFLRVRRNIDIGEALLDYIRSSGADMLVLGCYGHARLRELMLGSVSATVMRGLRVPALFSH